jgi:nicotinamidase-related amidase
MSVPRLDPQHSALLLVDLQERLLPVMQNKTTLLRRAQRLLEGASALGLPLAVTEQYPRGLGNTHGSIAGKLHGPVFREEKTRFSACSETLLQHLQRTGVRSVLVAGIEVHICVLQTCLDLLDHGYSVAVCYDAVSSRREIDRHAALERMTRAGVIPTTVEAALFELLGDADRPQFKAMQAIIQSKES